MRLIAVGRLRSGPEAELFGRYNARLRPPLDLREVADGVGPDARRREAAAILAALPPRPFLVALDLGGQALSSDGLAAALAGWRGTGRMPAFAIGGAEGLDRSVLDRADATLSFGRMTWPHLLVRAMLVEQIYRAQTIEAGHPYHRAGRP